MYTSDDARPSCHKCAFFLSDSWANFMLWVLSLVLLMALLMGFSLLIPILAVKEPSLFHQFNTDPLLILPLLDTAFISLFLSTVSRVFFRFIIFARDYLKGIKSVFLWVSCLIGMIATSISILILLRGINDFRIKILGIKDPMAVFKNVIALIHGFTNS